MEIAWVCISPADIAHNSCRSMVEWRDQTPNLTVYKADLYIPQVQAVSMQDTQTEAQTGSYPQLHTVLHGLLSQLFDGSWIPAAVSGFWCRQISSLLRHLIDVTFGTSSDFQTLLVCSLCCSNYIFIWSHLCPILVLQFFPCWGGILRTQACHNAFSIITNLESSLKTSINPNSSVHIVILTVKVFPFWQFY